MCGIVGAFHYDRSPVDRRLLDRMSALLAHRGPDAYGTHFDGPIGLAARRLSIIDVAGGNMPIHNEDQTITVVSNGEIYNYVELREELAARGHQFKTRSDTETIVHAYEEYGADCLARFNGMFAFALWDRRKGELLLARDRMGEKPLFYAEVAGRLLFASEIKSLLQAPECSREVDLDALDQYLTALYIPYPRTIFRDIAKLPPGHMMRVSAGGARVSGYWFPERISEGAIDPDEAATKLRSLLADAVRLRLRSDVPVGAMLSAGLDSPSVVAMAAKAIPSGRLETFAVGFEGADWDERPGARLVAERFETIHHEISVAPADVLRLLPRLVWLLDEPMGDGAIVPLAVLSALARQHVKVMLSGAGGDELFAGYPRYEIGQAPSAPLWLQALPAAAKRGIAQVGKLYSNGLGNRWRVALRTIDQRYCDETAWFDAAERTALTRRGNGTFRQVVARHYQRFEADAVNRLLFVDQHTYLSDDLLPMLDRATMGVSLEGRVPFLDPALVEWAMSLPASLKLRNGVGKIVLRRAMSNTLPPEILHLPKRGFGPPFGTWLRSGLHDHARKLLLGPTARKRGLLDPTIVERLLADNLDEHRAGQRIWMLLVLELWFRLFVDHATVSDPPEHLDDLL
jgi:asparagine synthase (glutamine-hydrolysing)